MNSLEKEIKDIVLQAIYLEPSTFNRVQPGVLTKDGGRVFVSQFSHFTRNFPCWLAAVASNCPVSEARKFLVANMYEEELGPDGQGSHYDLLLRQGEALGLTREQIERTSPLASTAVAIDALDSICRSRSWVEGLAATTGLECINHPALRAEAGVIIINDVRAWRHLGLNQQQLRSRTIHMEEDEKHVETGLKIISEQAVTEESATKAVAAAREALLAFRLLMEGIGRAALGE
ncbi:MAG TPA: iron-containing redox enzyme family protein [Verrucomicrobiae bacterium]|jgi:pyrroloquinoline quinone (PQQ) biosynthesis protein C|nr:iron-containing redox enzyme family protein [Verrucomicrobiae bacterium]